MSSDERLDTFATGDDFKQSNDSVNTGVNDSNNEEDGASSLERIFAAVKRDHVDMLKDILKVDPNVELSALDGVGLSPLHYCCQFGSLECAILLVDHINENIKDKAEKSKILDCKSRNELDTPMHKACHESNEEIVRVLIEGGALPDLINKAKCRPGDLTGEEEIKELLHAAIFAKQLAIEADSDSSSEGEDYSGSDDE
eukprot:Nk52_evm14s167 gene=Nk52_evmTU14s167